MTVGTLQVEGRKFRVIPEAEFRALCREARAARAAARMPPRKPRKTLQEMNAWMSGHWEDVLAKAKRNTKRLTGREVL